MDPQSAAGPSRAVETPRVGHRLRKGKDRGTVRYVGDVDSTLGVWIGVEWDDAIKGRHDGTHNGVRYFNCKQDGAGSFIRPSKNLIWGTSFLEALKDKYASGIEELCTRQSSGTARFSRKTLADIELETPNIEGVLRRAAQFDRRKEVVLDGVAQKRLKEASTRLEEDSLDGQEDADSHSHQDVACAFAEGESRGDIGKVCPNVQLLDLSYSLLPTWEEVGRISAELPRLKSLILQGNRLQSWDSSLAKDAFCQLEDLRLDDTMIAWAEAMKLIGFAPQLKSLQLGYNELRLSCPAERLYRAHSLLSSLSLEGNHISDWSLLVKNLLQLPQLSKLNLNNNEIPSIPKPTANDEGFQSLRHVSISNNPLSSWSDFENLHAWTRRQLCTLIVDPQTCPLLSSLGPRDARPFTIARLPSLQSFNHAAVLPAERRDAELFYLSTIEKQMPGISDDERQRLHPNWLALVAKHERPASSSKAATSRSDGKTLRDNLVSVRVHLARAPPKAAPPHIVEAIDIETTGDSHASPLAIDLLTTTPIRLLKAKLARSLGLRSRGGVHAIDSLWAILSPHINPIFDTAKNLRQEMRPNEVQNEMDRIVFELSNLDNDLASYTFCPGDELVVVLKA